MACSRHMRVRSTSQFPVLVPRKGQLVMSADAEPAGQKTLLAALPLSFSQLFSRYPREPLWAILLSRQALVAVN